MRCPTCKGVGTVPWPGPGFDARIERLEGALERIALYAPETKNGGALDRLMAIREIAQAALCGGAAGTQVTHTGDGHGDHG